MLRVHFDFWGDEVIDDTITRRNLPHWYVPGALFFVTYRLHGTIPADVLAALHKKREMLLGKQEPEISGRGRRELAHKRWFAAYDRILDQRSTLDWLGNPRVASMLRQNLYHHHAKKYHLLSYCIMPNHVHVLLQPMEELLKQEDDCEIPVGEHADKGSLLSSIMHSIKSYTAHAANALLNRSGTFWQSESYDHWVRDEDELERVVQYNAANPVKAGLVERPEQWFFCSSHDRYLSDGELSGWLKWPAP